MTVFDINDYIEEPSTEELTPSYTSKKDKWVSSLLARALFAVLFIADIAWGLFAITKYTLALTLRLITLNRKGRIFCKKQALAIKRASICAVSLFTAIFSPAIGILFGCTYFMVFDKSGIDEVVPSSLKSQFEEFFPS